MLSYPTERRWSRRRCRWRASRHRPATARPTEKPPLRTALVDGTDRTVGAVIDFAGWEMPVQYPASSRSTGRSRERVGLFDLSHMGEVWVSGRRSGRCLAYALVTRPHG